MFYFYKYNQTLKILTAASLFVASAFVSASNKTDNQITEVLSSIPTNQSQARSSSLNRSNPNSSVELDFSIASVESWDEKDSSNNTIANCITGDAITGFEYSNISITTVGGSFFSEAVIYFSNSNNGTDGLRLTSGAGDNSSGTKTFNSNGILDLTDNGLDDIVSLNDGVFITEFYENIDDIENAVDARYTNGTLTVLGVNLIATDTCPFILSGKDDSNSDLSVNYTTSQQGNPILNDSIEFTLSISNNGEGAATNVLLNNTLSNKLELNQFSCNDGSSTSEINDLDSFSVQDIANNSSLVCTIDTTVTSYGYIENSVTVIAENDINSSNNNASVLAGGAFRIVPINNFIALLLLALTLVLFARRKIT